MNSGLKTKIFSFLMILYTSNSVAARLFGEGTTLPQTGIEINPIIDAILFWDLGSGAGFYLGLTMFIATWAGFYFATRPLLLELYGVILDNFPTSDRRKRYSTTDDGEPIGMKGLALTSSFVTAQVIGQYLGFIPMIALGGIGFFLFLWSMVKGQAAFRENFNNTITDGKETEEIEEEMDDEERHEGNAQDAEDQAETDVEHGNTAQADEEARTAASELQTALEEQEDITQKLEQLMERDFEDSKQNINELKQTLSLEQEEEEIVGKIQEDLENIEISQINGEYGLKNYISQLENNNDPENIRRDKEDIVRSTGEIKEGINDIEDLSQNLQRESREEEGEIEGEIKRITEEIQELIEAHELIQRLKRDERVAEREEEELKQLDQRLGDENLAEAIRKMKDEERMLFDQEEGLEKEEQKIREVIEAAEKLFDKIRNLDEKEMKQLVQEEEEEETIKRQIKNLLQNTTLQENFGGSPQQFRQTELYQELTQIIDHIETVEGNLDRILQVKRVEDEEIRKAESKIEELLNQ